MTRKWKPTVLAILLALTLGMVPFAIDSAQAAFPAGTSAYWALDDAQQTAPGTYVEGIVPLNGTCRTVLDTSCPTAVSPGQVVDAQTFDGALTVDIGDGIDVAADAVFDWAATDSFSIAIWIRRDSGNPITTDDAEVAIGRDETTAGPGGLFWWIGINSDDGEAVPTSNVATFVLSDNGAVDPKTSPFGLTGNVDLADGGWHYLVGVRDYANEEIRLYVDGVEVASKTVLQGDYTNGFGAATSLNIGYLDYLTGVTPANFFTGDIDEVALFSKALTDAEVLEYYTLGDDGNSLGSGAEPLFESVVVGDLNGDGREDLAGVSTFGEAYYSLNLMSWVKIPGVVQSIVTGDFDGDGDDDIAGINPNGLSAKVFYTTDLLNWTPVPGLITSIVAGDFDGNGTDDIAGINPNGLISKIFYTLDLVTWAPIPGLITSIVAGDFDGDGTDDIAGINPNGVISKIFYTLDLVNWTPIPGLITSIVAGDFNDDGTDDIAGINPNGAISKIFYTVDLVNWTPVPGLITQIAVGDFDASGFDDDITGINPNGAAFKVFYTTDLSSWTGVPTVTPGALEMITTGDFDLDGTDDLAGINGVGEVYYTLNFADWTSIP